MIKLVLLIEEDSKDGQCFTTLQKVVSDDPKLKPTKNEVGMADQWHTVIKSVMEHAEKVVI